jgi:hypothetical protein
MKSGEPLIRSAQFPLIMCPPLPVSEIAPGVQGVWVVSVQHPQTVAEQLLERGGSPNRIPGHPPPPGEIVPGGQGVRVIGTQHPQTVAKQLLERGDSPAGSPASPRQRARLPRAVKVYG